MTLTALPLAPLTDPNANQRAASNPAASVWVNASAGSGKTTVLTARVTRLLLDGVRPERILCLTYTRAGAAEMANRVTEKLGKWAVCDDNALRDDLYKLQNKAPSPRQIDEARRLFARVLSCPGGLRIRTIHSFCQEILSRFPLEAGLPPHFSLIDEQELDVLGNEVLDDLLREAGETPGGELAQALDRLVAAQGEHGFTKMLHEARQMRGRLAEAAAKAGGEKKLIAQIRAFLQLEPEDTPETFRREMMEKIPEADLRQLAGWLAQGSVTHSERSKILFSILETPPAQRLARFDDYRTLFLTRENTPYKAFANKDILLKYPQIDEISTREATLLQLTLERIEAAEIAQTTASVLSFGERFSKSLAQRKAARDVLDYDDLIHFTEKLLQKNGIAPWILYKLDRGIDHVLVDEAQDTSRAQWNIVQALTAEFYAGAQEDRRRTLFVVGDEKQSIFSFQNANPESFLSLRAFFDRRLADAGKRLEKIPMHTSFRSAPAVLRAVDAVFAQEAARAGVSPDPITHIASRNEDGSDKIGRVEIWPLFKPAPDEAKIDGAWPMPTGYEEEQDPQAELAQQIALKIKTWILRNETLSGQNRPIGPGDIMILLRRRGRFADLMVRALKANNVPVTGVDRMRLVSQLPVMDLLAMLRFVLLPEDDLNLATVLRGPLLGLSEEQLMQVAIGRKGTLWHSLKANPLFQAAHDYLAAKLNQADFSTPFAFLSQLLNTSCPANASSGRKALWARLGDEALDPIEELLNEAQNFAHNHSPSLQNFLHWLTQADTEIKRELDRGGGQVRIMTVHAAKGLEAPIVFLPDTVALPRATDMPKFHWSAEGIPLFLSRQPKYPTAQRLWQAARDRQLEEYRRLFYVALTRASNRLYICGWQGRKNESETGGSWYGLAAKALRPLHQDFLPPDGEIGAAEIMFADAHISPPAAAQTPPPAARDFPLPNWASRPIETSAAPVFYIAADAAAASPDAAFTRGRIIHRLLQSLPSVAPDARAAAVARFLARPSHNLSQAQRDEIAGEVSRLLDDERFSALFAADSLAEAPLTGRIGGMPVFRQIDRLCLCGDEVWIVDYKTNRPPPQDAKDIPPSYRTQLDEYRILLRGIYPDKRVRCFLLWTYAPRLMEIT